MTVDQAPSLVDVLGPGSLEVNFQPLIEGRTGLPHAVEALARWRQTDGELLEPSAFLASVEQAGAGHLLDKQVLSSASRQVAAWRQIPSLERLELHTNLSPQTLRSEDLPDTVDEICAESGLPATALWLEVTESSVITDMTGAAATLASLRSLGTRITIDDFGVRYASLAYVKALPIDGVKVDRTFVIDIAANQIGFAIMEAVVSLASRLRLVVVAEGVETTEQEERLAMLGVNLVQGFLHGRPTSADLMFVERSSANALGRLSADYSDPTGLTSLVPAPGSVLTETVDDDGDERRRVLEACAGAGASPEPELVEIVRQVHEQCDASWAFVCVSEADWTRVVANWGWPSLGGSNRFALTSPVVFGPDTELVVEDARRDGRFAWHPWVRQKPHIRSLAMEALVVGGQRVGALLVCDRNARPFTEQQLSFLRFAASCAQTFLELRYQRNEAARLNQQLAGTRPTRSHRFGGGGDKRISAQTKP